jgi:hypothetical protein
MAFGQKNNLDSIITIETTGIFCGRIVIAGNFDRVKAYQINDYLIAPEDISKDLLDSIIGKKVRVKGKLMLKKGKFREALSEKEGSIYEPYKEPDKKFLVDPEFTIMD